LCIMLCRLIADGIFELLGQTLNGRIFYDRKYARECKSRIESQTPA
jgi:hypothetical protein